MHKEIKNGGRGKKGERLYNAKNYTHENIAPSISLVIVGELKLHLVWGRIDD